ncbi:MAG: C40 family peptidase [Phaeodactylibacter sp.]|nr:C40 family peptidase [Phaeodactylibacter sp.]MCB9050313.1 C40 family peptidase [Lewinellaceae bacterium]
MSYVICPVSIVPVRNSSSNKSEMISQLLFGELAEVLETRGRQWTKVRCAWDNFVGWVASNQLKPVTPSEFQRFQREFAYSLELFHTILAEDFCVPVVMGAQLPGFDGMRFKLDGDYFTFSGQAVFPENIEQTPDFILKIARKYLHAPFLWGGRSPMGIDAPGLIQMVFKLAGILLPREAEQQVYLGEAVDFVEQSRPGDIAFFENKSGKITHCGIILPNHEVLHAYGSVRIDPVDHFGIYNKKQSRYTHRLRVVKRVLKGKAAEKNAVDKAVERVQGQFELF